MYYKQSYNMPEALKMRLAKSSNPVRLLEKLSRCKTLDFKFYDCGTYKDAEGYYHVFPIVETKENVYVACPYCGKIHVHGNVSVINGWRLPHCRNSRTGNAKSYFIEALKEKPIKPPIGISPEFFWKKERYEELCEAIGRYMIAGLAPLPEWMEEGQRSIKEIEELKNK